MWPLFTAEELVGFLTLNWPLNTEHRFSIGLRSGSSFQTRNRPFLNYCGVQDLQFKQLHVSTSYVITLSVGAEQEGSSFSKIDIFKLETCSQMLSGQTCYDQTRQRLNYLAKMAINMFEGENVRFSNLRKMYELSSMVVVASLLFCCQWYWYIGQSDERTKMDCLQVLHLKLLARWLNLWHSWIVQQHKDPGTHQKF